MGIRPFFRIRLWIFVISGLTARSQSPVSITTQHNDIKRTGWNNQETHLNHASISSGAFGCIGTLNVDDEIYAQPLVVGNLTIGNYNGSVLFVATVNNTIYAFNGDSASEGAPLWQTNLNPAGQRSPNTRDLNDDSLGGPCEGVYRDFSGRFGIVGTPVIDTAASILYVATKTTDGNGNYYAYINALDLHTGQHKAGSPRAMQASVNGNGEGAVSGKVAYLPKFQNQRPGLLLYNHTVYVASASYCDWGPFHGWILGFDATTLDLSYAYNTTPDGWAGGIWMAGEGISVGEDGNLYVVTGNGSTSPENNFFPGARSESLIKLSPQLQVLDWFTPANYNYLDINDLDYGCDGALIIPNSTLTVSGSKEGISYVVDYNSMGKQDPTNSQVKDTLEFNSLRQGDVHVHGSPVYAKLSTGEFVYGWSESFRMRRFTLDRTTNTFLNNFQEGNRTLDIGMPGSMLSVSSNQEDTSSAIVWASFPTSGDANHQGRPGTLSAYAANDITGNALWSSINIPADDIGTFAKFNPPTIANGKVYAPTFSHAVKVYGMKCGAELTGLVYGDGTGLKGEYFSNSPAGTGFDGAATLTKLDAGINFNWGGDAPVAGVSNDQFKIRWTGKLLPLTDDQYTIYVTASDGIRVWVDQQLIIDSWADQAVNTHSATVSLTKGTTPDIILEYYSNTNPATCILQWSATGICRQNIPPSQLKAESATCSSTGTGILAEYFSNTAPAGTFPSRADISKTEPSIDFDWGAGSPDGISADHFKARFTGYVQSLDSGLYTFYATVDDGIRVWVNNKLLIDSWIDQATTEYQGTSALNKCTRYPIRVEYYENGGGALCKLEWSGPVFGRQTIASARLTKEPDSPTGGGEFTVYPNPNSEHWVNISLNSGLNEGDHVQIYNVLGQRLLDRTVVAAEKGQTLTLVHTLPAGMYVVKLQTATKTYVSKLLVR